MITADDVEACSSHCLEFLHSLEDRDWSAKGADVDLTIAQLVAHMTQTQIWYSIDLAAKGRSMAEVTPEIDLNEPPTKLLSAFAVATSLLCAVLRTTPPSARGWHPFGMADASGFAAMACDEMLIHTLDVAEAAGITFTPPTGFADRIARRLFPWAPDPDTPGLDGWQVLRWANGRVALDDRPKPQRWRWHCAPLSEWDGIDPTSDTGGR